MKQLYKHVGGAFVALLLLARVDAALANTIYIESETKWSSIKNGSSKSGQPDENDDIVVFNKAVLLVDMEKPFANSITLGFKGTPGTVYIQEKTYLRLTSSFQFGESKGDNDGTLVMQEGSTLEVAGLTTGGGKGTYTFEPGTGTIIISGSKGNIPDFMTTFNNLTLAPGVYLAATADLQINGNLSISEKSVFDITKKGYALTIGGNFTNKNGNFYAGYGQVNMAGTGSQTIEGDIEFYDLLLTNTTRAIYSTGALTVDNQVTVTENDSFIAGPESIIGGDGLLTGNGYVFASRSDSKSDNDFADQYPIKMEVGSLILGFAGKGRQNINTEMTPLGWAIANPGGLVTFNVNMPDTKLGIVVGDGGKLAVGPKYILSSYITGPEKEGTGTIVVTLTGTKDDLANQYTGKLNTTNLGIGYAGGPGQTQMLSSGSFKTLEVDNENGSVLTGDITLTNGLTLTSGNLSIGDYNLTINGGSVITGGADNAYISIMGTGKLTVNGVYDMTIPIGDEYAPVTISNGAGADYTFGLVNTVTDETGAAVTDHAVGITWSISSSIDVSNVGFTFQWPGANEMGSFDRNHSYIAMRPTPTDGWIPLANPSAALGSDPYTQTANMPAMTANNVYEFAVGDNTSPSPLPVRMLNFTAAAHDNMVSLDWQTASEQNNDYFGIERSADGNTWKTIAKVQGHGTANTKNSYNFIDYMSEITPVNTLYYRLKQVDYNGAFTYTAIRAVILNQVSTVLQTYPSPTANLLNINWANSGTTTLKILTIAGTTLYTENIKETGPTHREINMATYPAGSYIVQLSSGRNIITRMVCKD